MCSAVVKTINEPLGKYGRKTEFADHSGLHQET